MLTYSFHVSHFNNLSVFPEKPKFGSIYTRNIYNKIIIEILRFFWGVTKLLKNLVCKATLASTQCKFNKHMTTTWRINSEAQQWLETIPFNYGHFYMMRSKI